MKYTVTNLDTGAPFIQQQYDTIEEAEARLVALKAKVGENYPLAVSIVDEDEKPKKEKIEATEKGAAPTQPLRQRPMPRK